MTNEQIQALNQVCVILRAMASNYAAGHCWDHLDGETVTKAADGIDTLLAEREADKALIAEQVKRIAELESSHKKLRGSMAAIHNTIRLDGVGVSLSVLLSASKRAYEESAAAAGITLVVGE